MRSPLIVFILVLSVFLNTCTSDPLAAEGIAANDGTGSQSFRHVVNYNRSNIKEFPAEFETKSQYKINAINPTRETNPQGRFFPGLRGGNQLIIYTPAFGSYTGTNEYGKEATIIEGRVFSFNGANSYIPPNGYVISGHGEARKWINQNLIEGAHVKVCDVKMTIEGIINPQSYMYKANHRILDTQKVMFTYKRTLPEYQYGTAQRLYFSALEQFEKGRYFSSIGKYKEALNYFNSSILLAKEAFYHAVPAASNEFHGIWLRPVEKDRSEIVETLNKLKRTGINNVFLETFYHGYTIFPSEIMEKYGLTKQRPQFEGWDPLSVWIEEAKKLDMAIHIWFQAFYAGNLDVSNTPGHVLFVYPEWANKQRKNALEKYPQPSLSEHNGYFFDPANHMVRRFLLELIAEVSSKYEINGINIDYIRYPKSLSVNFTGYLDSTWGYTEYAREFFKKNYHKDPMELDEKHPLWSEWVEYRQNSVKNLVAELKSTVDNDKILVSAVIFPDIQDVSLTKLQNWSEWIQNGYIDALTPLIMSSDEHRAANSVREIRRIAGNDIKIYPGLFEPFAMGTPISLIHQIRAIRQVGSSGFVLFDNAHLSEEFKKALEVRILRN